MKGLIGRILLVSLVLALAAPASAGQGNMVYLENEHIRVGFLPELTGRMVFLELRKSPGNVFAPVTNVRIPLLPELTVICSNPNGGRVMSWEQGAFRANIPFESTMKDGVLRLTARAGDFVYTREFSLEPDTLVLNEKMSLRNCTASEQVFSLWTQCCGVFSIPSIDLFKKLSWYVPAGPKRSIEKSVKKSPARRGADSRGLVEFSFEREPLGVNVSVNPYGNFMALTNRESKKSVLLSPPMSDIDSDGFFNGWFGKTEETCQASIEVITNEKRIPAGATVTWPMRYLVVEGLPRINALGGKLALFAETSAEGTRIECVPVVRIPGGTLELAWVHGGSERVFPIASGAMGTGDVIKAFCPECRPQEGDLLFYRLKDAKGVLADEAEIFWKNHSSFSKQ